MILVPDHKPSWLDAHLRIAGLWHRSKSSFQTRKIEVCAMSYDIIKSLMIVTSHSIALYGELSSHLIAAIIHNMYDKTKANKAMYTITSDSL